MAVADAVRDVFGDELVSWRQVGNDRTMGFSGASIIDLSCECKGWDAPRLFVLKRTAMQLSSLPPDADEGARLRANRTDFSYGSECAFLEAYPAELRALGCRVPECLFAKADGGQFTVLLESLSEAAGWEQHVTILAGPRTDAMLGWLARFHAAFLPAEVGGGGLPMRVSGMWDFGTHNALEKRPASELEALPQTLADFAEAFSAVDPFFDARRAHATGEALQRAAREVAELLRPGAGARMPTMVHGDMKQANIFFRSGGERPEPEVAVIDWQWTGPGVGATDLIYLCAMALSDESLEDYEEGVLRPYHRELVRALGSEASYPYDELRREFELATLDFVRWLAGYRFKGFSPEKLAAAAAAGDINRGMWIRSLPHIKWLLLRAEEFLERGGWSRQTADSPASRTAEPAARSA